MPSVAVGAALGALFGMTGLASGGFVFGATLGASVITGALLGASIGSYVGGLIEQTKLKKSLSPRYQSQILFGAVTNTVSNEIPLPVLFGELKLYGNIIWQNTLEASSTIHQFITLSEGEIESISDVRVDDIPISELPGCSYTAYLGTPDQTPDSRCAGSVKGLKHTAYLAITLSVSDKLSGGQPTISCICEGIKIKLWDVELGEWVTQYSNNPVWVLREILTNIDWGWGINEDWIDDDSFKLWAAFCDELVDKAPGEEGTEKRATYNFLLDENKPAYDVIHELMSTFGGFLSFTGPKVKIGVETTSSIVQDFDLDNIINGSFTYHLTGKDDTPNRVAVEYVDPDQNYSKTMAYHNNEIAQREREELGDEPVVLASLRMWGITRFSQASRMARLYSDLASICGTLCSFETNIVGIKCELGDVITVTHTTPGWDKKPVRVLSMEESPNNRIIFVAREYYEALYDDSYGSSETQFTYGTPKNPHVACSDVDNLQVSESYYVNQDGVVISDIVVTFDDIDDKTFFDYYTIELKKDDGDYVIVGTPRSNTFTIQNIEIYKTYYVRVKTVSTYNLISSGIVSDELESIGKTAKPSNIEYFSVVQFEENLIFGWYPITDRDFSYYEIRSGNNWDSGKLVATIFVGTQYKLSYFQFGSQTYWIKAYDTSGNSSDIAKSASILITKRPRLNLVAYFSEYTIAGTPLETWVDENILIEWGNLYDKTYNRRVFDGKTYHRWDTIPLSWNDAAQTAFGWDNPKGEYPPDTPKSEWPYQDLKWQYPTVDLGAVIKFMYVYYEKIFNTEGHYIFIENSFSDDGITWTPWVLYQAGFVTARYIRIRGTIRGYNPLAVWGVFKYYDATSTVDMVDIRYSMKDIAISSGGTTIEFDDPFTIVPTLVATAMDNDGNDLIPVIDKSLISNTHAYNVFVKDLDGIAVNGFLNLHLEGY
jgi:hypothetical protein